MQVPNVSASVSASFEFWSRYFLSRFPTHALDPDVTVARNMASIAAVPERVLPIGPARKFLLAEACAGKDVYAYQALPYADDRWNVWYGPLAPRYDARVDARVWADYWRDLLRQADELEQQRETVRSGPMSRPRNGGV